MDCFTFKLCWQQLDILASNGLYQNNATKSREVILDGICLKVSNEIKLTEQVLKFLNGGEAMVIEDG